MDSTIFLAQAPVPIVIVDARARIMLANEAWREIASHGDASGQPAESVLVPELTAEIQRVLSNGQDGVATEVAAARGGTDRTYRARVQAVTHGGERYAIVVFADISDELAAERQLVAERALVGRAAHELRTPISGLLMWRQVLEHEATEPAMRIRALNALARTAEHTAELVADLLDVSRARAGTLEIDRDPVDIDPVVVHARARAIVRARERSIEVTGEIRDDLGYVAGSAPRLAQLLDRLVANALRAARRELDVRARSDGDVVEVIVAHDGPASPEQQALGAGLDLEVAAALTEAHGGTLTTVVDSDRRTMTLRLPRTRGQATPTVRA